MHVTPSSFLVAALTLGGTLAPSAALADQCAYIKKAQATAAARFVKPGMVIREYCEPCGQRTPSASTALTVKEVAATPVGGPENFWELSVNGRGLDLAYTYVPFKGRYVNLATLAKCPADFVSTYLDVPAPAATPAPKPAPAKETK